MEQGINNVKIIAIGKDQYSYDNSNWTDDNTIPVVNDPSPNDTWTNWDASQWDLFFLDHNGNYVEDFNINTWDYDNIYNTIINIISGCTDPEACNYDASATLDDGSCLENDCSGECGGTAEVDECGVCGGGGACIPEQFQYNQSTQQAFYYFLTVTINGNAVAPNDWVGAFNGDVCVGARQWDIANCGGGICDVPAMGYDANSPELTEGYMQNGDIPTFKIYDASKNVYYDAVASENNPWENYGFNSIDSLNAISNSLP